MTVRHVWSNWLSLSAPVQFKYWPLRHKLRSPFFLLGLPLCLSSQLQHAPFQHARFVWQCDTDLINIEQNSTNQLVIYVDMYNNSMVNTRHQFLRLTVYDYCTNVPGCSRLYKGHGLELEISKKSKCEKPGPGKYCFSMNGVSFRDTKRSSFEVFFSPKD